jgi:hypothetical protein
MRSGTYIELGGIEVEAEKAEQIEVSLVGGKHDGTVLVVPAESCEIAVPGFNWMDEEAGFFKDIRYARTDRADAEGRVIFEVKAGNAK